MDVAFTGIGCESCLDSLPARLARMRGVESATVDAKQGLVRIRLAEQNRIRPEQVRDAIEQDGTKVSRIAVVVKGVVSRVDGKWILRAAGMPSAYDIDGSPPREGENIVTGEIAKPRPETGNLVIRATEWRAP
jgi:hypothetical protein